MSYKTYTTITIRTDADSRRDYQVRELPLYEVAILTGTKEGGVLPASVLEIAVKFETPEEAEAVAMALMELAGKMMRDRGMRNEGGGA